MTNRQRQMAGILALLLLSATYLFQRSDFVRWLLPEAPFSEAGLFILNRYTRVLLNDAACLLLIHVLFQSPTYNRLARWVFLAEVGVLLPLYLVVKLITEGPSELSAPWLAQFHRMIVNPLLMFLLIAALFAQRLRQTGR